MRGRGAATLPGTPVLHNPTRGMGGATSSPHGAAPRPLPTGTGVLRRAQPATSDGASRHHSTSRTTLTILATTPGAVTQTRHPNDLKRTTGEGARQTDRHEHEHSTTELEQRPGAPEAVPRTPWLGYGIQPVSGPLTPSTEGKTGLRSTNPMYGRRPLTPGASPAGACSVP